MGILSAEQAEKILSKRIYIRSRKQEKKFTKIRVFNPNRIVLCKVCFKKIIASDAIEVIGGSEQGHRSFWMCREHM